MLEMKVKVSKKNIRDGTVDSATCPIALAIRDTVGENTDIQVNDDTIQFGNLIFVTPKKAVRFINRFDNSEKVKPFEFTLKG